MARVSKRDYSFGRYHAEAPREPERLIMIRLGHTMSCEEKARLIEDHSLKALAYARAARALQRNRGTTLPAERAQLKALTDKTRFESKEARRLVRQHIAEHGC
jgi:hypothetical protein